MKCFDVVQSVLDATYGEVPDTGGKRDKLLAAALKSISDQYRTKLMTDGGPDFRDPAIRFGYVYLYVPAHSHWLYELLTECPGAKKLLSGKARISCIGGGPGSDLVGVLKFLDENRLDCKLFCEIIDGCEYWKSTWADLAYVLDLDSSLHTDYVIHDVEEKESWDSPCRIDKADIITLNFFVSEVYRLGTTKTYLMHMLSRAKPGAILLVNDNRTPAVYKRIDGVAKNCGYETLLAKEGERKIYDWGEKFSVLKKYQEKFDTDSKLTGNMCWRIFRKQ